MSPRKRARALAAPFILTSALAACGPSTSAQEPHRNPPAPDRPPQPPGDQGPVVNPPGTLPDAPGGDGKLEKRDDGTCWWISPAPTCPPNTLCNPPPPSQVKCPE